MKPSSVGEADQKLCPDYDETDSLVLHRFFQTHSEKIGKELLGLKRPAVDDRSRFTSGKDAWDAVCAKLVELGAALETPILNNQSSSRHGPYQQFMHRNRDHSTDTLNEVFSAHHTAEVRLISTCIVVLVLTPVTRVLSLFSHSPRSTLIYWISNYSSILFSRCEGSVSSVSKLNVFAV